MKKWINFRSFRTSIFLIVFFSCLISLSILSFATIKVVNIYVEQMFEENLFRYAGGSQNIYNSNLNQLLKSGIILSENPLLQVNSIGNNNKEEIKKLLKDIIGIGEIDIATLINNEGKVIVRANSDMTGDTLSLDGLVNFSLSNKLPAASTEIISAKELTNENPDLLLDTKIRRIPTLYQGDILTDSYETDGMGLIAVVPIIKNDKIISALVLVDILNRDYRIPDEIERAMSLKASIYQEDITISTTIKTKKGNRYTGTLLFESAINKTLRNGVPFVGRVRVLDQWRRSVYLPIKNHNNRIIGALTIEIWEDQFKKSEFLFKERDFSTIIIITTIALIFFSLIISYFVSIKLIKPINQLIEALIEVSKGNFEQGVNINSYEEINKLANTFNFMVRYVRKQIIKKEREIISRVKKTAGKYEKK